MPTAPAVVMATTVGLSEGVRDEVARLLLELETTGTADTLHGVTLRDGRLILAGGDYLVRVVPDTGRLVDEIVTSPTAAGLSYDGRCIWQYSGDNLQQLEARTGFVVRSVKPNLEGVTGLECHEGDLLILHTSGRALSRIRLKDHALSNEAVVIADAVTTVPLRGLTWAGGELWSATVGALVRIDPVTARVLRRLALPAGVLVRDVAADTEGRIWCVDGLDRKVRAFAWPDWAEGERPPPSPPSSRVVDVAPRELPEPPTLRTPASVAASMFARILVPIDFSASSRRALATALLLQERMGAQVDLFHLAELGANAAFLAGSGAAISAGDVADDARGRLARFVDNVFPGRAAGVRIHVTVGSDLVGAVEKTVRETGATLVLLASGSRHTLLRNHVEKVIRIVDAAVMLLPPETAATPS
jgi:nucleotide-binding universal stress UspA family protein